MPPPFRCGIIEAMRICGLGFNLDVIHRIRQTLDETPSISRRSLARQVCEWNGWTAPSGRHKEAACRRALTVLDGKGLVDLAPSERGRTFEPQSKSRQTDPPMVVSIACSLADLGRIDIEMVTSSDRLASMTWKSLMDEHHYLGSGPLVGAQIRYLIHCSAYGYIGAMSFSSAAWALMKRDEFIGWTEGARRANLQRVVCNSRFLIIPTISVHNLASHVLSQCANRIVQDWTACYGIEPVMLETFVDPQRFSGTCYRAANWIHVGKTSGRRANERHSGGPKDIFLYPLRKDWREILRTEPHIGPGQRTSAIDEPADWVEEELGTAQFYDPRLNRRLFELTRDFYSRPQAPITEACGSHAKAKAAYRFFENKRVSMKEVLSAHLESTIKRIKPHEVVLAVQDTTSVDYTGHRGMEGLGPTGHKKDAAIGLLVHDTMAFTADGTPLGLLDVQCWARDPQDRGKKERRKELPIEQKESMKWLKSYQAVCEVQKVCPDTVLVSVGDRESDIYELFLEAAKNPHGPKLLVRCERTRNRKTQTDFLWEVMAKQPVAGMQMVRIPRKGCQLERDAKLEVRYAPITLKPPRGKKYAPVSVWMVYAREIDCPKSVKSPLEWMLLTTAPVDTFEDACERLAWYAKRWGVEIYHRTLKSGCRIEDRWFDSTDSLEPCLAIDMVVAWRIYHLTKLGREVPDHPCTIFFKEAEWKALYILVNKTTRLPAKEPTMHEAVRMLARLGGFLGRKRDGEPGTTTLWRGIQRLEPAVAMYVFLLPQLKHAP